MKSADVNYKATIRASFLGYIVQAIVNNFVPLLFIQMQKEFGTSVILITHNMGIVAEIADDVAVMYMGRIVEHGTVEQIFTKPAHPYTKALMRSVPVLGMDKNKDLDTIEGSTPDASTVFTGCEFAERCTHACDRCFNRFPVDTVVEEGHTVRCLLFEEVEAHAE